MVVLAWRPTADRLISGAVLATANAMAAASVSASGRSMGSVGRAARVRRHRRQWALPPAGRSGSCCSRSQPRHAMASMDDPIAPWPHGVRQARPPQPRGPRWCGQHALGRATAMVSAGHTGCLGDLGPIAVAPTNLEIVFSLGYHFPASLWAGAPLSAPRPVRHGVGDGVEEDVLLQRLEEARRGLRPAGRLHG